MRARLKILALPLAVALAGCTPDDGNNTLNQNTDAQTADAAALSVGTAGTTAAMIGLFAAPVLRAANLDSPAAVAAAVAASVAAVFNDPACAKATASGSAVTLVLTACDGPYGITQATGSIVGTFTTAAGGALALQVQGSPIQINGVQLDLTAQTLLPALAPAPTDDGGKDGDGGTLADGGAPDGSMAVDGGAIDHGNATLTITTTSHGSGLRQAIVAHEGNFSAIYENNCVTVDGTFRTLANMITWSTMLAGYHRCGSHCADLGKAILISNAGAKFTLTYTGAPTAGFTSSSGKTGNVILGCSNAG